MKVHTSGLVKQLIQVPSRAALSAQVRKEPKEVQKQRQAETAAANTARRAQQREAADGKTRMKVCCCSVLQLAPKPGSFIQQFDSQHTPSPSSGRCKHHRWPMAPVSCCYRCTATMLAELCARRQAWTCSASVRRRPQEDCFLLTFVTALQGKNRPTRRAARKKDNIIEEKKMSAKQRVAEEQRKQQEQLAKAEAAAAPPEGVPRALHTFYRKA